MKILLVWESPENICNINFTNLKSRLDRIVVYTVFNARLRAATFFHSVVKKHANPSTHS